MTQITNKINLALVLLISELSQLYLWRKDIYSKHEWTLKKKDDLINAKEQIKLLNQM